MGVLALCAASASAWPARSINQPAVERQRRLAEDLLGRERWRQLQEARFEIYLHTLDLTRELSDDPRRQHEVGRVLVRSLLKSSQEALERRLRLEERRDALRDRFRRRAAGAGGRRGLDVTPRFRLDSRFWLGAKLRLRGRGSHFLAHADLRLGSELDGRNPSIKLAFMDHTRHGFLVYHLDHRQRGEAIELRYGFSF